LENHLEIVNLLSKASKSSERLEFITLSPDSIVSMITLIDFNEVNVFKMMESDIPMATKELFERLEDEIRVQFSDANNKKPFGKAFQGFISKMMEFFQAQESLRMNLETENKKIDPMIEEKKGEERLVFESPGEFVTSHRFAIPEIESQLMEIEKEKIQPSEISHVKDRKILQSTIQDDLLLERGIGLTINLEPPTNQYTSSTKKS